MTTWNDPKRYAWFLAALVPLLVMASWLLVKTTGIAVFWWLGPLLVFVGLPIIDYVVGIDRTSTPGDAHIDLDRDHPLYGLATCLYLPNQYLSLIFACWLWSGGGWLSMSLSDKLGLMVTVGISGGIGINAAHELGHRRVRMERWLSKLALAQTCYGHFFVEHNRGHHVRVATPQDNASSRLGEDLYRFLPRLGDRRCALSVEAGDPPPGTTPHLAVDPEKRQLERLADQCGSHCRPRAVVSPGGSSMAGRTSRRRHLPAGDCQLRPTLRFTSPASAERPLRAHRRPTQLELQLPDHQYLLFHLQRHSDHHANPRRRFTYLRGIELAPQLPAGYATMFLLAAIPPLWRRVMDPRVINYYGGRVDRAALHPRRSKDLLRKYSDRQVIPS